MNKCLFCKKESSKEVYHEYYKTSSGAIGVSTSCSCEVDGWLYDGFLFPYKRRYILCSVYNNVENFHAKEYAKNQQIVIKTKRGKLKSCVVLSVFEEENVMIIQENNTNKIMYVCDYMECYYAYDAMFSSYRRQYSGWKHKTLSIID